MSKGSDPFDRGFPAMFVFAWILSALLSLGFIGVIIWAIITLVMHFTS